MRFHRVRQPGIKWHATTVQSQENLTLHCTNKMCGTKNYSHTVPPPWKGFSLPPLPTKLNTFALRRKINFSYTLRRGYLRRKARYVVINPFVKLSIK